MKKKILIIITTDFVPYGGLATVMMNYYRALVKTEKYLFDFASTNEKVDQMLLDELHENQSEYYYLGNRKKSLASYMSKLSKLLKEKHYDIVHINSNSATAAIELTLAKKYGVNRRIVHNHTSECDHKVANFILFPIFKKLYTDAIAVSNNAGKWLFPEGNFVVLNNGINCERFRFNIENRLKIREKYNIDNKVTVIGHLGKIYKPKNHAFLIDIFESYHAINPDSMLLLVGDGEMREIIERNVCQRGLKNQVVFAGMQSNVEKYLSAMDIFVFPSLWEGMPLSVIEAQASGLPCIISDTIDKAVCISNYTQTMSLQREPKEWANFLERIPTTNRENTSDESIDLIKKARYDTYVNSVALERIYDKYEV